ncbi:PREDICTED: probable serine/threonine-protein kinase clkA [Populus euphratica]|uniref:Probable serine/threonine-protein kinase clkA n=1 Tax=Populus euphratica TaxID=75702 RepID=A0AAJ6XKN6_POPEU|nr:PREDICTED: probable serine/threonine-protein kinase clkA [Populus euphratica]
MENNRQSFYQFSDQLRVQTPNLANLSLNDSIWSNSYGSKRPDQRRNFDIRVGAEVNNLKQKGSDLNSFNDGWNPISDLKPKGSDVNLFNDGWNPVNDLKARGSNLNLFNEGWNSVNDLKPKGSNLNVFNDVYNLKPKGSDLNVFNDGWKMGSSANNYGVSPIGPMAQVVGGSQKNLGVNGGFSNGIYSKNNNIHNNNLNISVKGSKNKGDDDFGSKSGKKNSNKKSNSNDINDNKSAADKRFKTLPPSESLPRYETIGGYIFVCNNDTMAENLKRELFGLPPRYRDSVRQITPGLPLFLYNYSTHQLHGVFEAASFGGTNIDPSAWEDKKCPGESRFPAQVRVMTRKVCEPLEEDSFRPVLHHYDGPKFRLELNIPEALSLLDIFEEQNP